MTSLLLLAAVLVPLATDPLSRPCRQDRVDGWTADLDQLLARLERDHYLLRGRGGLPDALLERADWLREAIPALGDARVLFELQRLAVLAGDGHTVVRPFAPRVRTTELPLRFYLFSDGLFVIDARAEFERWIGSEVLAFGQTETEVVLAHLPEWISHDNEQGVRWSGPNFLRLVPLIEALAEGIDPQRVRLTLRDRAGKSEQVELEPREEPPFDGTPKLAPSRIATAPPPMYLQDVARAHWFRALDERTLYVQFNQVVDDPGQTLADFATRLGTALAEQKPARLLIDVRHNNGGDGSLLTPLLDVLHRFEQSRPDARLVVLMGRNTFSAAQIFLGRVDRQTNALFAGEPSSSCPNFVGESNMVRLAWSGATANISNRYHETIPGDTRAFIAPDLAYELSSDDYFSNRDPLLEKVLAWEPGVDRR